MKCFVFGVSPAMQDLEQKAAALVDTDLPILIEGENGTGKESLARYLHSLRANKGDFVRLFGPSVAPPTFSTDAISSSTTIFLKHIHLLPRPAQERLFMAIEDNWGVGANYPTGIGELISSASVPLEECVSRGEFLTDLYFRLSARRLFLPPLRARAQEVPELFLSMANGQARNGMVPKLPNALVDRLMRYPWPGNFHELQNIAWNYAIEQNPDQVLAELDRRSQTLKIHSHEAANHQLPLKDQVRVATRQLEGAIILRTLERHRWNRRRAAQTLQISYRSLLYKMKNCNLRPSPPERIG